MAGDKGRGHPLWGVLALLVAVGFGLWGLIAGWSALPLPRERLTIAEHVGPLSGRSEIVRGWTGRRGGYRAQIFDLAIPGGGLVTASPPPTLWIDDADRIPYGERTRLRVDTARGLIYEATTGDRTLLAYEASAENRRTRGRNLMLGGLVMLGLGGFNLSRLWRDLRRRS